MDMPKPTPGHDALGKFAGDWRGDERMYPSPWDPKGGTATGRHTNTVSLGGFALVTDYEHARGEGVAFTGIGMITFNPASDEYTVHWFDSMGSPPEVFVGHMIGDVLTASHGGATHSRLTWALTSPSELHTRIDMSSDGVTWNTMFEGRYHRR